MERLLDQETIDDKTYKVYDIDEKENNLIAFPRSIFFEQYLITENDKPKYLVGLYQDGEIWSEDECWGTRIADLETVKSNNQFSYVAEGVDLYYYISNNIIIETLQALKNNEIEEIYI